jgi:hypothetical protein
LRARPEQTQSEDLSDAFFLGELLVLSANVSLDWKVIARYKQSSLFGLVFCSKEKTFYNIDTRLNFRNKYFPSSLKPDADFISGFLSADGIASGLEEKVAFAPVPSVMGRLIFGRLLVGTARGV